MAPLVQLSLGRCRNRRRTSTLWERQPSEDSSLRPQSKEAQADGCAESTPSGRGACTHSPQHLYCREGPATRW